MPELTKLKGGATELYEKAGMRVALQYDTYEKELRPGQDLMKRDN
jgi:hypothetical protein